MVEIIQRCKKLQMLQIYVCYFFSAGANFWAGLGHFWAILAIFGNFWAILGNLDFYILFFLAVKNQACKASKYQISGGGQLAWWVSTITKPAFKTLFNFCALLNSIVII